MQRIEIIGNIGNDAEIKDFQSNQVINFNVAVSETFTNKTTNEKTTNTIWFSVQKWGNNTSLAQYLLKGTQVFIAGKVANRAWIDKDGNAQISNGINAFEIQLLGKKEQSTASAAPQQSYPQANQPNSFVDDGFKEEEHDDLPF